MRSEIMVTVLAIMIASATGCTQRQSMPEADYVFEHVNVVPLNEETVLMNRAVAVRDGRIVLVVDQSLAHQVTASNRIDASGKYMMPGLADMHVHTRMEPQAAFNLYLANGVTTVFNMGLADRNGDIEIDHLQLRADVAAGRMIGPRYLVSGPQLRAPALMTQAEVDRTLDNHAELGFDTVKVHGAFGPGIYDYLVDGAHARGLRVTGHMQHARPLSHSLRQDAVEHMEEFLYTAVDPSHGIAATGSVENYLAAYLLHAERMSDPAYRAGVVDVVAASDIHVVPTLIIYRYILNYVSDDLFNDLPSDKHLAYLPERVRDEYLGSDTNPYRTGFATTFDDLLGGRENLVAHLDRNIQTLSDLTFEMHQAGVPLLLGTDAFGAVVPGFSIHQELALLVDAGLTPYEALRTGTVNSAAYLGELDRAGTLEVGKRADFVLVAGNPLDDIGKAATVAGVFTAGTWHSASDLDARLAEIKALYVDAD